MSRPSAGVAVAPGSVPLVLVVDDDASVRRALARLLRSTGFAVEAFPSAADLLARVPALAGPACLVLDVRMPGIDGLELQARLGATGCEPAIVFLSGQSDVPTSVRAMKAGAVDFLEKPVDAALLTAAVRRALERDVVSRRARAELATLSNRYATLTPRERDVLRLVTSGLLNKLVAARLGTSEKTIKVHRGRAMVKMGAASFAQLVRMAGRLGVWA